MQKHRYFLSVVLSLSIAFPPNVWAQTWNAPTEEQIADVAQHLDANEKAGLDHILNQVEELQTAFTNPEGPMATLDDFDLLQQEVVDQRKSEVDARVKVISERDFETRRNEEVDFLLDQAKKDYSRTIEFIGKDQVQVAANYLELDVQKDLIQIIEAARTDNRVATLLDIKPEELEHFVDENVPTRRLYRMNLKVNLMKVQEKSESLAGTLNQKDSEGSTASSFTGDLFFKSPKDESYRFDITTSKGEVIHRFNRPVSAVGFYGRFLIYVDQFEKSLRFIDLDYFKGAIGNTPLASFELPLKVDKVESIAVQDGKLVINGNPMVYDVLTFAADLYQVYFNIKVGLIDPKTASSSANLIKEIVYYKDQALSQMDQIQSEMINSSVNGMVSLESLVADMETKLNAQAKSGINKQLDGVPEKLRKLSEENPDMQLTFNPTVKVIQDEVLSRERLTLINRSMMVSRKFMSRMHLLMAKLVHPQPMGSPKIIQGMVMLAESALKRDWNKAKSNWNDLKKHPLIAYGKFGAGALAAAAIGATISDSFALTLYETLNMAKDQITGYFEHIDYAKNFVRLGGHASGTVGESVATTFKSVFMGGWSEGSPAKLGILMSAMGGLVFSIYGSLHLIANVTSTVKYFSRHRGWIAKARSEGASAFGAYKMAFVKYQNALKIYYDKNLSQSESWGVKFNSAQEDVVDEVLKDLNNKKPGFFKRIYRSLTGAQAATEKLSQELQTAGDKGEEFEEGLKQNSKLNKITTLRKALRQFALSYPSTIITSRTNGTLWNNWFMIRTFMLTPKSWPMFLAFPEFFRVSIQGQGSRLHMPSKLNGGYRHDVDNFKFVFRNLNTDATLKDLKTFETSVLPVEALAYEVALEKSLEALVRRIKDPKMLKKLFDSSVATRPDFPSDMIMQGAGASASTGIRSVGDPKIQNLSKEDRTFFRSVFDQLYPQITEQYLKGYLNVDSSASVAELKDTGIDKTAEMMSLNRSLAGPNARVIQNQLKDIANDLLKDGKIVEQSSSIASDFTKIGERYLLNSEYNVVQKLNPDRKPIIRFKTAERKLKDIKAVIRAVNAMVTDMVWEKGGSLLTILVMYSAVTSGMLAPLQDQMFGPDSWFYGSRYLFLNSFASGVVMSALASVWMKVQIDDRIDATGAYGTVPTAQDRDKSYLRYYLKSLFKNPVNAWKGNQINSMQIAISNLSAAFVTISLINFVTLGRFDLGAFLTGYMITFLTPLSGFDYKIDQTHELASRWQASKVMRKLRAHPKMQAWINKKILQKRHPHSAFSTLYSMFMGPIVGLYEMMDTTQFGNRSFLNLLFYGYQPEEIVSAGLQKVNKYLGFIPGVEHITSICESLLTNNNTALDPTKLIHPPTPPISGN